MDIPTRLTTRQIVRLCRKCGYHCEMYKTEPPSTTTPPNIAKDRRYWQCNAIKVAQAGKQWQFLGWRWQIEAMSEEEIVHLLSTCQSHVNVVQ